MYMSSVNEARKASINALDKAYNETRELVDKLVKTSKQIDNMRLVQAKLDNLELYINTLKTLDSQTLRGGRKTRKNRRQIPMFKIW